MKQLGLFLKTATLGGLFKTGGHYPRRCYQNHKSNYSSSAGRCPFPIVLAVLLVLAVSFLVGLILTSRVGSQSSEWMEQTIFFRLPADAAVKNIVYGLADGKVSLNLRLLSSYD